jgi:hypothetical protein
LGRAIGQSAQHMGHCLLGFICRVHKADGTAMSVTSELRVTVKTVS